MLPRGEVMRFFGAYVQNRQLVLNVPTRIPEGTVVQLVSINDAIDTIRVLGEDMDRVALHLGLEASLAGADAGRTLDVRDFFAKLRAERVFRHSSMEHMQEDDDKKITIYQSVNREGPTFSLSLEARRMLQGRFG